MTQHFILVTSRGGILYKAVPVTVQHIWRAVASSGQLPRGGGAWTLSSVWMGAGQLGLPCTPSAQRHGRLTGGSLSGLQAKYFLRWLLTSLRVSGFLQQKRHRKPSAGHVACTHSTGRGRWHLPVLGRTRPPAPACGRGQVTVTQLRGRWQAPTAQGSASLATRSAQCFHAKGCSCHGACSPTAALALQATSGLRRIKCHRDGFILSESPSVNGSVSRSTAWAAAERLPNRTARQGAGRRPRARRQLPGGWAKGTRTKSLAPPPLNTYEGLGEGRHLVKVTSVLINERGSCHCLLPCSEGPDGLALTGNKSKSDPDFGGGGPRLDGTPSREDEVLGRAASFPRCPLGKAFHVALLCKPRTTKRPLPLPSLPRAFFNHHRTRYCHQNLPGPRATHPGHRRRGPGVRGASSRSRGGRGRGRARVRAEREPPPGSSAAACASAAESKHRSLLMR